MSIIWKLTWWRQGMSQGRSRSRGDHVKIGTARKVTHWDPSKSAADPFAPTNDLHAEDRAWNSRIRTSEPWESLSFKPVKECEDVRFHKMWCQNQCACVSETRQEIAANAMWVVSGAASWCAKCCQSHLSSWTDYRHDTLMTDSWFWTLHRFFFESRWNLWRILTSWRLSDNLRGFEVPRSIRELHPGVCLFGVFPVYCMFSDVFCVSPALPWSHACLSENCFNCFNYKYSNFNWWNCLNLATHWTLCSDSVNASGSPEICFFDGFRWFSKLHFDQQDTPGVAPEDMQQGLASVQMQLMRFDSSLVKKLVFRGLYSRKSCMSCIVYYIMSPPCIVIL